MRLAFSTNAYVRYPLEEAIESIARLGYDGVEILADRPHAFLDEEWDAYCHQQRYSRKGHEQFGQREAAFVFHEKLEI